MKRDMLPKPLVALNSAELKEAVTAAGGQPFRAKQIEQWLFEKFVQSPKEMRNVPASLLETLLAEHPLGAPELVLEQTADDGTRKFLLRLHDGAEVECVALTSGTRLTACISSQVGCAMGCTFCATGQGGFKRNLNAAEITEQVRFIAHATNKRVDNVVFMGQGEPFLNTASVMEALLLLNDHSRFNIGARKMTVSTAGLIEGIRTFAECDKQFGLAISLHAARQSVRDVLMPGVCNTPLTKLKAALKDYTKQTNRRVTLEYLLIAECNDSAEDLDALLDFCQDLHVYVNVLRLHTTPACSLESASKEQQRLFLKTLREHNIEAQLRVSKGEDVAAACGQLAQHNA